MFGKFSEQLKKSSKPINSLMAMNAKAMEDLSQNQTELFTGLLTDSVKFIESVTVQTEVKGVVAAGSEYAESMRDRFAMAAKGAYSTLSHMQAELKDVMKTSLDEGVEAAKTAVAEAPKAPAAPKKAAPKPAAKATPKPKAPAKPKAEPAAVKAEAPKPAPEKAVEAPAATPAPAAEAKPAEAPKPAAKKTTRARKTTTTRKAPAKAAPSTKSES